MIYEQLKLMLYGYPGSGKTVLLGTALDLPPEGYLPALFLDFEQGQRSIRSKCNTIERTEEQKFDAQTGTQKTVHTYNIEQFKTPDITKLNRIVVNTWEDFREVYRILTTRVPINTYKMLMIDTMSQVDRICQDAVAKNTMSAPFEVKPITMPEMGHLQTHMVWLINAFIRTGAHIIITAHITEKEDPGFTTETTLPMLTTIKLRQEISAICDAVGYTYTLDSKQFNISFSKNMATYAKFRAEDPSKIAGKIFSSNPDPLKNEFNLKSFLKAIGDIP